MTEKKMRYFSPAEKRVVARYGTDSMIGATRTAKGFVINTKAVVAIPEEEVNRYSKEYRTNLQNLALVERTEEDYKQWLESRKRVARVPEPSNETTEPSDAPANNNDADKAE